MIKNLSVNVKGFIAFGLLAAIAIGACTLIFTRSVVATQVVEENVALFEIISASDEVMEQVVEANLALKNFLLTGDRSRVDRYQEVSDSIDADLAALEGTYTKTAPEQLALVRQAAADLNSWRQTVVERQIDFMRNPMTVDMARAIELTGEGSRMLEAFYGNLGQAVSALETRAGAGAERQMQVLSAVETISLLASVVVAFGAVLLAFLNFRMVSRPLAKLAAITQRLADGDLDVTIEKSGKDEIGRMADAMEIFREGAIANRKLEREAKENRRQAEADRLAAQERAEADAAERLRIATSGLAGGLKRLAAGDLACRLEEKFAPDFEDLRHDFNRSVEQLGEALRSVAEGVSEMERGTREIAAGSDNLSRRTENQAASLEETAAAVEQITANVASSSKRTEEARLMAVRATESAAHSAEVVTHAEQAIHKIEESSEQIANIIGVIDDIAFQTNLLALNAGVEAARAGEAGKGFAVVAQEVRELAQRSASAAKEIRQLISKSTGEVSSGVNLVRDAGEALRTIGKFIVEMNDHIEAINTSAKEQATGLTEVNQSVNAMDQMTQQNAAMVEQSNAATAALADGAAKLRELVTRFNLGGPVSATGASGENLREMSRSMARSWPEAAAASRPAAGKPKAAATAPASSASPKPASAARSAAAPAGATAAAAADADWEEF